MILFRSEMVSSIVLEQPYLGYARECLGQPIIAVLGEIFSFGLFLEFLPLISEPGCGQSSWWGSLQVIQIQAKEGLRIIVTIRPSCQSDFQQTSFSAYGAVYYALPTLYFLARFLKRHHCSIFFLFLFCFFWELKPQKCQIVR